jgi:signal transduction histidine kinase
MRARALHLGGRLTLASPPGGGTEVRLDVPPPEEPE